MAATAVETPVAGPSRPREPDEWAPKRYLEPNHPDNEEVLEQAAYQAAVTRPAGDNRSNRKYKPRRTVDYMGGVQKWRMVRPQEAALTTVEQEAGDSDHAAANTPQPLRYYQCESLVGALTPAPAASGAH